MRTIRKSLEWVAFADGELSAEDQELRDAALEAAGRAWAPYSKFRVGAAVRLEDGSVVTGCNQENSAYPSGLCAERCALFRAGAEKPDVAPAALALIAVYKGEIVDSPSPCGGCRQVMMEVEERYGKPLRTLLCGKGETVVVPSVRDLMPLWGGLELDTDDGGEKQEQEG